MFPRETEYQINKDKNDKRHSFLSNSMTMTSTEEEFRKFKKAKHKKFFNKKKKAFIALFFYIISSIFSYTFLKYNSLLTEPFQAAFFHSSSLVLFIPLTFLFKTVSQKLIKKEEKEKERVSQELSRNLSENFSDLMEKKYYENYYHYYREFYINIIILIILYFSSISTYYQSLKYTDPLFTNLLLGMTGLAIIIIKMTFKGVKCLFTNFILIFLNIMVSVMLILYYLSQTDHTMSTNKMLSLTFLVSSVLSNCGFIYYFKRLVKKYKYYISIPEVSGFIGLFSLLIVPFLLVGLYYLKLEIINFPTGPETLIILSKSLFIGCVSDFLMFLPISLVNKICFCSTFNIILGSIYSVYFIVKKLRNKQAKTEKLIFFIIGESAAFLLLIFTIVNYYQNKKDKKKRRIKNKMKQRNNRDLLEGIEIE